jgi:GNAT superfamily N-acetyltransferase
MIYEWHRGEYTISTDPGKLDVVEIHRFLSEESYWAKGRSLEVTQRAIEHSVCLGLYHDPTGKQIGFSRVITDFATYAYIADVFVLPAHRGHGLGKWLVQCILAHPDLQGLRGWALKTADAHGLYAQYGFASPARPETAMELQRPNGGAA